MSVCSFRVVLSSKTWSRGQKKEPTFYFFLFFFPFFFFGIWCDFSFPTRAGCCYSLASGLCSMLPHSFPFPFLHYFLETFYFSSWPEVGKKRTFSITKPLNGIESKRKTPEFLFLWLSCRLYEPTRSLHFVQFESDFPLLSSSFLFGSRNQARIKTSELQAKTFSLKV